MADGRGRETEQAVEWALEAGYRHIDTAAMYRNEQSVGAALARSGLPREQVFVTTKLMPDAPSAARELEKSLERLGFDYVDLYLIHWPMPLLSARLWRQLESLQERGLARAIGVSNFGRDRLERLIGGAPRACLPSTRCSSARSTTGAGCSTTAWSRGSCSRPTARSRAARASSDPAIAAVAERLGRTPAQVMLRWAIQHQAVVIPKSSHKERIRSNAQLFDFELADADMQALDALDRTGGSAQARG